MRQPSIEIADEFWAPRIAQLRDVTLPTLLARFEAHGVVEAFSRLRMPDRPPRNTSWLGAFVSDSDLYKWTEAAALAGRTDLVDPVARAIAAAQDDDGYLHTYFGQDGRGRYGNLGTGHELYCMGHFVEAAVSHHEATGSRTLLDAAIRVAAHVAATFGPGRDERFDSHPELELALCRLGAVTGDRRLVELAAWMIERPLREAGLTLETVEPAGHAVRFLYLTSGIAEIAIATGDARFRDAALRLWSALVLRHSHCTGAVGGRWMGEAVGRSYELDDETSYAESCASVAMAQLARRIWRLVRRPGLPRSPRHHPVQRAARGGRLRRRVLVLCQQPRLHARARTESVGAAVRVRPGDGAALVPAASPWLVRRDVLSAESGARLRAAAVVDRRDRRRRGAGAAPAAPARVSDPRSRLGRGGVLTMAVVASDRGSRAPRSRRRPAAGSAAR